MIEFFRLYKGYVKICNEEGLAQLNSKFPNSTVELEPKKYPFVAYLLEGGRPILELPVLVNLCNLDPFTVYRGQPEEVLLSTCCAMYIPYTVRKCDKCNGFFDEDLQTRTCSDWGCASSRYIYLDDEILYNLIEANLRLRYGGHGV